MPTLLKNPQICPSNSKTSKVFTKSQQNLKKKLNYYSNPCSIENKSSSLSDSNVPKSPAHNEKYRNYSEILKFVLATAKHQKSAEKVNKIYKNY